MTYTKENDQEISMKVKLQNDALNEWKQRKELYDTNPMKYSRQIHNELDKAPLIQADIKLDGIEWLYVKSRIISHEEHRVKLHIPLKNWEDNALKLANIISQMDLEVISAIKTINPLLGSRNTDVLSKNKRTETGAPITIYFKKTASSAEIANAIYQIERKLNEVDQFKSINSGNVAGSDQKIGTFCAITIDKETYEGTYIEGISPEGIEKRQELLRASPEIKEINNIFPNSDLLEKIDNYVKDRIDEPDTKWNTNFFNSYTKEQKIEAANALKKTILTHDASSITEHLGALTQGNLKGVFKACQNRFPNLLDVKGRAIEKTRLETTPRIESLSSIDPKGMTTNQIENIKSQPLEGTAPKKEGLVSKAGLTLEMTKHREDKVTKIDEQDRIIPKQKVILLDFDDTIETEKNGQIVLNNDLLNALKQAQDDGAIIIGYTNWYSLNYTLGAPGRKNINDRLVQEGLSLRAVVTTWSFLDVFKSIDEESKKQGLSHMEYIGSLNEEDKINLLGKLFQTINTLETENKYSLGKGDAASGASVAMIAIENELGPLRENAKNQMGLAIQLPKEAAFNGGKEEMFRAVLTLLGDDKEYIVFDDKPEVSNVVAAVAEEKKVTAYGFCVQRMKMVQKGHDQPESFSYEAAIAAPSLVKNQVKMKTSTDASISIINNLITRITPEVNWLGNENKKDVSMKADLDILKLAMEKLSARAGTGNIKNAILAADTLNDFYKKYSDRLAVFDIKKEEIFHLKQKIDDSIAMQKEFSQDAIERKAKLLNQSRTITTSSSSSAKEKIEPTEKSDDRVEELLEAFKANFNLTLRTATQWGEQENALIGNLNKATYIITTESKKECPEKDYSIAAKEIADIYEMLQNLPGCTTSHKFSFQSKSRTLLEAAHAFEEKMNPDRVANLSI